MILTITGNIQTMELTQILTVVGLVILAYFVKDYLSLKLQRDKDIHFKDCDSDITQDLINRFPLVKTEFISKSEKEQNVENNQEIHEINKRLVELEQNLINIQEWISEK